MLRIGRHIGAALLLFIFVGYWSSIHLFPHAHRINGRVYVHSHPFTDKQTNHTHSQQEFQFIKYLSYLVMTVVSISFVLKQILLLYYIILIPRTVAKQGATPRIYGLRAPPCGVGA